MQHHAYLNGEIVMDLQVNVAI